MNIWKRRNVLATGFRMNAFETAALIVTVVALSADPAFTKQLGGRTDLAYAGVPKDLEGICPIQLPKYEGQVKQLLPIDNRRLIVAVYDVPEVVARMDALSGGELVKAVTGFEASEKAGRPNWTLYRLPGEIHAKYLARPAARLASWRSTMRRLSASPPTAMRLTPRRVRPSASRVRWSRWEVRAFRGRTSSTTRTTACWSCPSHSSRDAATKFWSRGVARFRSSTTR